MIEGVTVGRLGVVSVGALYTEFVGNGEPRVVSGDATIDAVVVVVVDGATADDDVEFVDVGVDVSVDVSVDVGAALGVAVVVIVIVVMAMFLCAMSINLFCKSMISRSRCMIID